MFWAIIIIVGVIACFLIPKLGKTVLVVGAVFVGIIGLIILGSSISSEKEQKAAKQRIKGNEIELSDMSMTSNYGTSFKLNGRVKNNSTQYMLDELELNITMRDCIQPSGCEIIGGYPDEVGRLS
jgi:hypothetical protein